VHDLIRQFQPGSELADSRNEIVVGEVIRAMARLGHPSVMFRIHDDRQQLRFRANANTGLSSIHVTVERPSGSGALSEAMFGNHIQLKVVAEVRQQLSHPAELLRAALPSTLASPQGIRVQRELSSVLAHTTRDIDIDQIVVATGGVGAPLVSLMRQTIRELAGALRPHLIAE
jgi:hypothetical protein